MSQKFLKSKFMQYIEGHLLKRIFPVHFVARELNMRYDIYQTCLSVINLVIDLRRTNDDIRSGCRFTTLNLKASNSASDKWRLRHASLASRRLTWKPERFDLFGLLCKHIRGSRYLTNYLTEISNYSI